MLLMLTHLVLPGPRRRVFPPSPRSFPASSPAGVTPSQLLETRLRLQLQLAQLYSLRWPPVCPPMEGPSRPSTARSWDWPRSWLVGPIVSVCWPCSLSGELGCNPPVSCLGLALWCDELSTAVASRFRLSREPDGVLRAGNLVRFTPSGVFLAPPSTARLGLALWCNCLSRPCSLLVGRLLGVERLARFTLLCSLSDDRSLGIESLARFTFPGVSLEESVLARFTLLGVSLAPLSRVGWVGGRALS